jgi:Staphylococcal nuclease homologue
MHQTCADGWPAGLEAAAAMRKLIAGRAVVCEFRGHDRYKRSMGLCRAGGKDLGANMVGAGMAWASNLRGVCLLGAEHDRLPAGRPSRRLEGEPAPPALAGWPAFPIFFHVNTTGKDDRPFIEFTHRPRKPDRTTQRYRVHLRTTPQPLGGLRWWFECSPTGRPAVKRFLPLGGY